ncbi:MAG: hypothetical protein ABJN65_09000 [Parasphingorhabdus sp.]
MELPCVLAIALAAGSPSSATLSSATKGAEAIHMNQEITVECTGVMLDYFSAGEPKKTHSENCSDHDRVIGNKSQPVRGGVHKYDGDSK